MGESISQEDEEALQAQLLDFFPELQAAVGSEIPDAPVGEGVIPDAATDTPVSDPNTAAAAKATTSPQLVAAT